MSLGQFFAILRARWIVALSVFVGFVALAVTLSLVLPKKYTAVASVVVDPKPDPISAAMYAAAGVASPSFMATQVDIIGSDRVAYRVVRNLKLTENPEIRQQWQEDTGGEGTIEQWLITLLQKSMDVKPSRESNVISVSYKAPDPRFAAAMANAYVQAFLETSLELRVDPARQYNAFFDNRVKEARDALEAAQTKLSVYQKKSGILIGDERLDVETARLNELSSQLVMVQALSAESGSRVAQVRGGAGDRMQEVINNPLISGLRVDVSRAEASLQQLSTKLGVNHPSVVEAKANLEELRSKLNSEVSRVTSGVGVSATINRQREAELRASVEAQRAKVLEMKANRDESSVLVRDVENAQRNFDLITARYTQTNLESQTTQSNANVLTQAVPPFEHSSPRLFLNTLIATFLGIVFGIATVMALEKADRRVRAVEELPGMIGLPVLGILPDAKSRSSRRKAGALSLQGRLLPQISKATR